jgi:predicted transposase YbfD/YdcC
LIGVKKNQIILYNKIETILEERKNICSSYITMEINKGRFEVRNIMVSDIIDGISDEWVGLKQIIRVQRIVKIKNKKSEEIAYFISSRNENAFFYEEGVRSHWSIENSLHWVKDVTLKEDESKIRMGNAPQNISTIKNIAINLFRSNDYKNLAQAIRLVSNDITTLNNIIN